MFLSLRRIADIFARTPHMSPYDPQGFVDLRPLLVLCRSKARLPGLVSSGSSANRFCQSEFGSRADKKVRSPENSVDQGSEVAGYGFRIDRFD